MVVLGILLVLGGLVCGLVVDDTVVLNGENLDMDLIGWILAGLGAASILFGLIITAMRTNTSHSEERDVLVERDPDALPRRRRRY